MSVLILAEHKKGALGKGALVTVNGGKAIAEKLGLEYDIVIVGNGLDDAAATAAKLGARKVYVADNAKFDNYFDESWAEAVAEVKEKAGATVLVAASTTQGKAVMSRLAGKYQAGMACDILGVSDAGNFLRPVYAGNITAEIAIDTDVKIVTVRGTAFDPIAEAGDGEVEKVDVAYDVDSLRKTFVEFDEVVSDRPPLTEAEVIVSFGRGIKDPENLPVIEKLADVFGAAIGATRAVVDAGWIHNDYQVGQTGKTVAPGLYIAVGLSGAIQHLAGMKDSKVIVAINKDEEAQIFSVADYGIVADLFNVVPELTEKALAAKG